MLDKQRFIMQDPKNVYKMQKFHWIQLLLFSKTLCKSSVFMVLSSLILDERFEHHLIFEIYKFINV